MSRAIIHADLDAFYASVEQLDRPELRGKPVAVGGPPESRGVVMAASYEARKFGVRSALPMSRALRLCPQLVRVPARFERYHQVSQQVMAIFRALTPLVEPLSLDEAFLDVTEVVETRGGAEALARWLKGEVKQTTGLTISLGVGTNKSIAKIASDMDKPDGLVIVPPGEEAPFLRPLPVRTLWGIGPKTEAPLLAAGFRTVGDLADADLQRLAAILGSRAEPVQAMARGVDDRPVEPERERKSVGSETTFAQDIADGPELRETMATLAGEVAHHLQRKGIRARTVSIKLRYADFTTITRQRTLPASTDDGEEMLRVATGLLDAVVTPDAKFRLIGVQASGLTNETDPQLGLWQADEPPV
jgi:DNA polymerase-4